MGLLNFLALCTLIAAGVAAPTDDDDCSPIYVRWSRVRLNLPARVSGPYNLEQCVSSCSKDDHPAKTGYPLQCSGFNQKHGPRNFAQDCQIYQKDQVQNLDGNVEADDQYAFFWKYCIKSKKECKSAYHFDFYIDRYMDFGDVERRVATDQIEDCLDQCLRETSFQCRSISFNRTAGFCYLSAQSRLSKPTAVRVNSNPNYRMDYYENNCYNDGFKFTHDCQSNGIRVTANSKFPYTGAMYGLYDFFTCRIEPKGETSFSYFFPYSSVSKNCSDSMSEKDNEVVLDVVLSTDNVEPLYFLTDEDTIYHAKCDVKLPHSATTVGAQVELVPPFTKSEIDVNLESNSSTTAEPTRNASVSAASRLFSNSTLHGQQLNSTVSSATASTSTAATASSSSSSSSTTTSATTTTSSGTTSRNYVTSGKTSTIGKKTPYTLPAIDATPSTIKGDQTGEVPSKGNKITLFVKYEGENETSKATGSSSTTTSGTGLSSTSSSTTTTGSTTPSTTSSTTTEVSSTEETTTDGSSTTTELDTTSESTTTTTSDESSSWVYTWQFKFSSLTPTTTVDESTAESVSTSRSTLRSSTASGTTLSSSTGASTSKFYRSSDASSSSTTSTPSSTTTTSTTISSTTTSFDEDLSSSTSTTGESTTTTTNSEEFTTGSESTSTPTMTIFWPFILRSTTSSGSSTTDADSSSTSTTISLAGVDDFTTGSTTTVSSSGSSTTGTTSTASSSDGSSTTSTNDASSTTTVTTTITGGTSSSTVPPSSIATSPPAAQKILFDITHNGQSVNAVVVGSRITLSFLPSLPLPGSYLSLVGCQVEPVNSPYAWERDPLQIVRNGCQADGVGLVCPPVHTDSGVKLEMEAFRYTTTAEVLFSCLARVCPYGPCPQPACLGVDGCSPSGSSTNVLAPIFAVNNNSFTGSLLGRWKRQFLPVSGDLQQNLAALAGDHVLNKKFVVVNSEPDLQYYLRTGNVPSGLNAGFTV